MVFANIISFYRRRGFSDPLGENSQRAVLKGLVEAQVPYLVLSLTPKTASVPPATYRWKKNENVSVFLLTRGSGPIQLTGHERRGHERPLQLKWLRRARE